MKYLFEDSVDKFPYRLLTKEFSSKVFGANGNNNLPGACRAEFVRNTYVFIDVNADNAQTVSLYNKLARESKDRVEQYVIPIPSIEYYFVRAFIGYENSDFSTVLNFGNYIPFGSKNYENFIKDLLKDYKGCYADRKFEEVACLCDVPEEGCKEIPLSAKCKKLELSLPILISREYTSETIQRIIELQKELYYKQAYRFHELGIISKVLELKY